VQSTGSGGAPAMRRTVSLTGLAAAFARLPDPRRQASLPFPVATMPCLAVTARLAQQTSVSAMAEWGVRQSGAVLAQPGFPTRQTRCQSTLPRLFATLDGHALCATFAAYVAADATPPQPARTLQWAVARPSPRRGML
jgi:hypothetical protein